MSMDRLEVSVPDNVSLDLFIGDLKGLLRNAYITAVNRKITLHVPEGEAEMALKAIGTVTGADVTIMSVEGEMREGAGINSDARYE